MKVSSLNLMNNILTVVLNEPVTKLDRLRLCIQKVEEKGKKFDIEIKEHEDKRSLSANRYMWVLCTAIAKKLSTKDVKYFPIDIYKKAIREAGRNDEIKLKRKALKSFQQVWDKNGVGWFSEVSYELPDCDEVKVWLYYGSSCYNVGEMRQLLDYIIADCKELGIETKTEAEIESLLKLCVDKGSTTPQTANAASSPCTGEPLVGDDNPSVSQAASSLYTRELYTGSVVQEFCECYFCGNTKDLEEHHVFGGYNRDLSEKYKLKVKLCNRHHTGSYTDTAEAVHHNAGMMQELRKEIQIKAMEYYGWSIEDFRERFNKNYV